MGLDPEWYQALTCEAVGPQTPGEVQINTLDEQAGS